MEDVTNYEVVIPTNKTALTGMLCGLVQHAPFPLRIVSEHALRDAQTLTLLDTLSRLGCRVRLEVGGKAGMGHSRYLSAQTGPEYDVLISMDDDVVMPTPGAFGRLAAAVGPNVGWATPIVRFAQNFVESTMPEHTEVWDRTVSADDPEVERALKANGPGWLRVFETGHDQTTDQLSSPCFAVGAERFRKAVEDPTYRGWQKGAEDAYLSRLLGSNGVVLSGVYAYHFGWYDLDRKWGGKGVAQKLAFRHPDLYNKLAGRYDG